ncbi:MAG: glycosyltransferase [Polyangiaceae bacterium]
MTICLNMIVKNEASVLARCLDSVIPFIDSWLIVDTGSSDGTQQLIREKMAGIPGELHERPWLNFGHNRSEALRLARDKADYLLLLDADEAIEVTSGLELPRLTADEYLAPFRLANSDTTWYRTALIRAALPWRYVGVLHEYLTCEASQGRKKLDCLELRSYSDGARNVDPIAKYAADARLLEAALRDEPHNDRYVFYLAQSYRDCGEIAQSLATYERRLALGGWDEELFYARFQCAVLKARLERPWPEVVATHLEAFEERPTRAEPLCALATQCRMRGHWVQAELFARAAALLAPPEDILFVDQSVYQWRAWDELAIATYYRGKYRESAEINRNLLSGTTLPEAQRARVTENLAFANSKLASRVDVPARFGRV